MIEMGVTSKTMSIILLKQENLYLARENYPFLVVGLKRGQSTTSLSFHQRRPLWL